MEADQSSESEGEPSLDEALQVLKKRPYKPPVLQEWGNFEDLTQANGNNGKADGGRPPFSKTR